MKTYTIGIDLGGTLIKIGLVCDGQIIAKTVIPACSGHGLGCRLERIEQAALQLLADNSATTAEFAGVGICFPGLADSEAGRVVSTNAKYDDAIQLDLADWAQKAFGGAFYIDNDARMAAVGEWKFGEAQGIDNSITMTLGTGIGCGVVIEGRILKGKHHQAGCLGGHFVVDYLGRKCSCGNIGCAEAMASSFFLNDIVAEAVGAGSDFYLQHAPFDFEKLFQLAGKGDSNATAIRNQCMDIWAANIVTNIHAYDPEIVVLSGGIMRSAETIIPYIQKKVDTLAWTPWGQVKITVSKLMDEAAILGVAACVNNKNK